VFFFSTTRWKDDDDDDNDDVEHKGNSRKRKSRWSSSTVKQEPTDIKFMQQIHEGLFRWNSFLALISIF